MRYYAVTPAITLAMMLDFSAADAFYVYAALLATLLRC